MFVTPVLVRSLEMETHETIRAIFSNQNAAFSEAHNEQMCHDSFGTISTTKSLGYTQLNMNYYYINTSVLLGFLPLRKSIYFHM